MRDMAFGIVYNEYHDGSSPALSGLGVGGKTFVNEYSWDGIGLSAAHVSLWE